MTKIVVDASVALSWALPNENDEYADSVLVHLADPGHERVGCVPSYWHPEVLNALLAGERRGRVSSTVVQRAVRLWNAMGLETFESVSQDILHEILHHARMHGLTMYDAAYLDLAIRLEAPLATLDSRLRTAAGSAGVLWAV